MKTLFFIIPLYLARPSRRAINRAFFPEPTVNYLLERIIKCPEVNFNLPRALNGV